MIDIQSKKIDELKAAPYNPRIALTPDSPAYHRLKRSLDEFGVVQPIVWNDRTGHVVGGHQRLEILKAQGIEEIEVVVVSIPLDREKLLNIALNNQEIASDWDPDKLSNLIVELDHAKGIDVTLTGFDRNALNSLLLAPAPTVPDLQHDIETCDKVSVRLLIDRDEWEKIRPALDEFIAAHSLEVHIEFPSV